MTTELQVRANQQNAQLSTGPRTEEGKRKVSLNRITHGLLAKPVVIQDEDAQAFEQMRAALLATLKPVGDLELFFADRAAVALWRLHRVLALEGRLLLARQALEEGETAEQALSRELELVSKGLPGLSRYETQLENKFGKAIATLRSEQDIRALREAEARQPLYRRHTLTPAPGPWAQTPPTVGEPAPGVAESVHINSDTQSDPTPSDHSNPIDLSDSSETGN